jgi:hypothetical protein
VTRLVLRCDRFFVVREPFRVSRVKEGMNISLRRRAAAFTLLAVGATACGNPEQVSPVSSTDVPLPKIVLSSNMSGHEAMSSAAVGDSKMFAAFPAYTYTGIDGDLGLAQVWRFDSAPVDLAKVKALAALFGVEGDPVALSADQGGGYVVGSQDYSGPALYVYADGLGSWSYSPGFTYTGCLTPPIAVDDAVEVPSVEPAQGSTSEGMPIPSAVDDSSAPSDIPLVAVPDMSVSCVPPAPEVNDTLKEEAERMLADVLAAVGTVRADVSVTSMSDDWSTSATAAHRFGGVDSAVSTYVGFSAGELSWASGILAVPTLVGSYPQVTYQHAVERFNTRPMWPAMPYAVAKGDAAAVATDVASSDIVAAGEAVDGCATSPADLPVEVLVPEQQEPVAVGLSSPAPYLVQVWDADGTVWLVPAYRFKAVDGEYSFDVDVVSLVDEYLVTPDMPVAATSDTSGVQVVEEVVPMDPVQEPVMSDVECAAPSEDMLRSVADTWVGLTETEAVAAAEAAAATLRVVSYDGVEFPVTADWSPTRVNVEVVDGVVVAVVSIG